MYEPEEIEEIICNYSQSTRSYKEIMRRFEELSQQSVKDDVSANYRMERMLKQMNTHKKRIAAAEKFLECDSLRAKEEIVIFWKSEGLTNTQLSKVLGCSDKHVKRTLDRACENLAKQVN